MKKMMCALALIVCAGCSSESAGSLSSVSTVNDEPVTCTSDDVLENVSEYEGKEVIISGIIPQNVMMDEEGNPKPVLYASDQEAYLLIDGDSTPDACEGQNATYHGTVEIRDGEAVLVIGE